MFHKNENEVPFSKGHHGVKYIVQGPEMEMGVLVLLPGEGSHVYGVHYHEEVDETFYFTQGTCSVEIKGQKVPLKAGDVLTVEKGEKHRLFNDGTETVKAVFFKYPYRPKDRVEE